MMSAAAPWSVVDGFARNDAGQHFLAAQVVGHGGDTPHRATSLCCRSTLSTSAAAIFSPLRRITFFRRSTKYRFCSASRRTTSPVWNQPPSQAASVASGSPRYSVKKPARGSGPAARTSSSPGVQSATSASASIDDAVLHEGLRPAEAGPADMPRLVAGDDHRAGAGLGHGPGVDHRDAEPLLERSVVARIDAGREAEPHADARDRPATASRPSSIVGITPRLCMMVASLSRTVCHQLRGWNRSSGMMQPPVITMASVEYAIALTCIIGSGVISRSSPGPQRAQAADLGVPAAAAQEIVVGQHAALRLAGGAGGVEQGAFRAEAGRLRRARGRGAAGCAASSA